MTTSGKCIHINGVVQGVGFRPFIYNLAQRHQLTGWVRNTSGGVDIHAEGLPNILNTFIEAIPREAPPLAHIDSLTTQDCPVEGFTQFEIRFSAPVAGQFQPISPDIATCDDCLHEMNAPTDHRYRYPFINCTNCGPRFTIIQDIPYDRPFTTMSDFPMCDVCKAEYHDPTNRRFHAQPVACPDCGPQVWLEIDGETVSHRDDAIVQTIEWLHNGKILAIKGLGGFHLACDATNAEAVRELRKRKHRIDKPFALMMRDLDSVRGHCTVNADEARILTSKERPVVLLNRRTDTHTIPHDVAPNQTLLGVMLPYTPLHHLLFADDARPLVMTSANFSDEPIVTDNDEARAKLSTLADAFLMHDRDIHIRTDDSVVRVVNHAELPIRRSRGYAPYPVHLPFEMPSVLAVGGEMKNTFCITRDGYAFMSHHIGNMENYETLQSFEQGITHFERLFRIKPAIIAYDMHPDYWATRYATQRAIDDNIPAVVVQHHHAHVASVMAEHNHTSEHPVIGVCFDGTGYGTDGTIWGGEFLISDYTDFDRAAHLKPIPLPGGDVATRKPARMAYAYLVHNNIPIPQNAPFLNVLDNTERRIIEQQVTSGLNTPMTSSMGRLFDVVSSLLGVCHVVTYEGQAAIELEVRADSQAPGHYPFTNADTIDTAPIIRAILGDIERGETVGTIAGQFHNTIAQLIHDVSLRVATERQLNTVALSGGVFQNVTLLQKVTPLLEKAGLTVLTHRLVPPNDGGLALGQAVIAAKTKAREITV